jgi:hypothetical protein
MDRNANGRRSQLLDSFFLSFRIQECMAANLDKEVLMKRKIPPCTAQYFWPSLCHSRSMPTTCVTVAQDIVYHSSNSLRPGPLLTPTDGHHPRSSFLRKMKVAHDHAARHVLNAQSRWTSELPAFPKQDLTITRGSRALHRLPDHHYWRMTM